MNEFIEEAESEEEELYEHYRLKVDQARRSFGSINF